MALPAARRDFIQTQKGQFIDPYAQMRAQDRVDRRDRSREAVALNGGRSAPQAINSRAMGLTPDAEWETMFPRLPNDAPRVDPRAVAPAAPPASTTTPAPITPSAPVPPPVVEPPSPGTMDQNAQADARARLYQANPDVFQAGTPANVAFVAHAKQFGEESAHANLDKILGTTPTPAPVAAAPTTRIDPRAIASY